MVREVPPKPLRTGNRFVGAEPPMITREKFPPHVDGKIWGAKTRAIGFTRIGNPKTSIKEFLEKGRAEAERIGFKGFVSLVKNATVSLHAVLFPVPIPTAATVRVIDKEFHMKGDINWDGKIDDEDIELLVAAYRSESGLPNWNPDCDLNEDGKVDLMDLVLAAVNYGKTAPEYETSSDVEVVVGKCVLIATAMEQELEETVTTKADETTTVIFVYDVPLGMLSRAVIPPIPGALELPVL